MKSMLMYIEDFAARGGQQNLLKAKQLILQAEKMEPDMAVIKYVSAIVAAKMGDIKTEESKLFEALKIFPEYRDVLKQIIYLYSQTSRIDEAKTYLEKYKLLFPNDEDGVKLEKIVSDKSVAK